MTDNSLAKPTATGVKRAASRAPKRKLASQLHRQLRKRILAAPLGKTVSREQYLAKMLTDLATNYQTQTLEGDVIKIGDMREWIEIIKFIHTHIDGPVGTDNTFNGVNIFKVYAGIDMDKV